MSLTPSLIEFAYKLFTSAYAYDLLRPSHCLAITRTPTASSIAGMFVLGHAKTRRTTNYHGCWSILQEIYGLSSVVANIKSHFLKPYTWGKCSAASARQHVHLVSKPSDFEGIYERSNRLHYVLKSTDETGQVHRTVIGCTLTINRVYQRLSSARGASILRRLKYTDLAGDRCRVCCSYRMCQFFECSSQVLSRLSLGL